MNEKVAQRISGFRETFSNAKQIAQDSFDKTGDVIKKAIDTNKQAAQTKTIVDTSTEWMILVKNDAFEKGRKEGYSAASEHMIPVLEQKKAIVDQISELANKTLDALGAELSASIDALANTHADLDRQKELMKQLKSQLKKRDALVSELKADLEKLKKENDALQEKAEDKPRRGRPKKKKVDDPLA